MTSRLDDRIRVLMQRVAEAAPPPPEGPPAQPERVPVRATRSIRRPLPGWAVAAVVAVVVLGAIGAAAWLGGSREVAPSEDVDPPVISVTTTTEPAVVDEATARREGVPYDPAVHDLCAWFDGDEIAEVVSDAYEAAGATAVPSSSYSGSPNTYPPVSCTWGDGTGAYMVSLSVDGELSGADARIEALADGEVAIIEERDRGRIDERVETGFEPADTVSDELSLVGARVWDWYAWRPPGPPARWRESAAKLRLEGRADVYVWNSVISDPPVEFDAGFVPDRLLDVGLAIADELLQRMHWIPQG